jgi:hypothetical protein
LIAPTISKVAASPSALMTSPIVSLTHQFRAIANTQKRSSAQQKSGDFRSRSMNMEVALVALKSLLQAVKETVAVVTIGYIP